MNKKITLSIDKRQLRIWVEIDELSVEAIARNLSRETGSYVTPDQVKSICKDAGVRHKNFKHETFVELQLTSMAETIKSIENSMDNAELISGDMNEVVETVNNQEIVAEAMFKVSNELINE